MNKGNTGEKEEYLKKIRCVKCEKVISKLRKDYYYETCKGINVMFNGVRASFQCKCGEVTEIDIKKVVDFFKK